MSAPLWQAAIDSKQLDSQKWVYCVDKVGNWATLESFGLNPSFNLLISLAMKSDKSAFFTKS